jgi:hypothetical protein
VRSAPPSPAAALPRHPHPRGAAAGAWDGEGLPRRESARGGRPPELAFVLLIAPGDDAAAVERLLAALHDPSGGAVVVHVDAKASAALHALARRWAGAMRPAPACADYAAARRALSERGRLGARARAAEARGVEVLPPQRVTWGGYSVVEVPPPPPPPAPLVLTGRAASLTRY